MWRWIVLGLAFSSVLVLLVATPVWGEDYGGGFETVPVDEMPDAFLGAWTSVWSRKHGSVCAGKYKGVIYPDRIQTQDGVCVFHILEEVKGKPIVLVKMECRGNNNSRWVANEGWVLDKDRQHLTLINLDTKKESVYQRCEDVVLENDEVEGSHGPGTMNDVDFYKSEEWKRIQREDQQERAEAEREVTGSGEALGAVREGVR